jgi:hypothetical protein
MKQTMIACASLLALCGCTKQVGEAPSGVDADVAGFRGVVESNGGAIVSSHNRCTVSFLFDDLNKQRLPKPPAPSKPPAATAPANPTPAPSATPPVLGPDAPRSWRVVLSAPDKLAGAEVAMVVRGAYDGSVGPVGSASIAFGGKTESKEFVAAAPAEPDAAPFGGDKFELELKAPAAAGDNTIIITLQLAPAAKPDDEQHLQVFSLDLVAGDKSCPPPEAGQAQPIPAEPAKPEEPKPEPAKP